MDPVFVGRPGPPPRFPRLCRVPLRGSSSAPSAVRLPRCPGAARRAEGLGRGARRSARGRCQHCDGCRRAGLCLAGGAGGGRGVTARRRLRCGQSELRFPLTWWHSDHSDPRNRDLSAEVILLLVEHLYPDSEIERDEKDNRVYGTANCCCEKAEPLYCPSWCRTTSLKEPPCS